MTDHDDDPELRAAFQRWRNQVAATAPGFPGIPDRRKMRASFFRVLVIPASVGAAASLLLLLSVRAPSQPSLKEILPRPLLAPSPGENAFLVTGPVPTEAAPSDFLRPGRQLVFPSIF